jgi:hypothetical protein
MRSQSGAVSRIRQIEIVLCGANGGSLLNQLFCEISLLCKRIFSLLDSDQHCLPVCRGICLALRLVACKSCPSFGIHSHR